MIRMQPADGLGLCREMCRMLGCKDEVAIAVWCAVTQRVQASSFRAFRRLSLRAPPPWHMPGQARQLWARALTRSLLSLTAMTKPVGVKFSCSPNRSWIHCAVGANNTPRQLPRWNRRQQAQRQDRCPFVHWASAGRPGDH